MKRNRTIQLKAIFLLTVFSLNTLLGFACAVGLNMGFNAKHHHEEGVVAPTIITHHHEGLTHHHHHEEATKAKNTTEDRNCCNNSVIKFSQLEKLLVHAVNVGIEIPVVLVHLHFICQSYLSSFVISREQIQVVRPYVLSSRGIRVSIQSFQI
ncbi:hypothetical protein SAMN05444266_10239 [Chitinophaga jiangningensis]|uniref:Uncharacterized protein n=1 Tax=Chitinophaga jiangningensis TaxID=1419482 RepID=A0A1M6XVR5_9BACT|nr:hypothetical protein [Chitinophaga jiangningensis]SHL09979.1 hypothetical protein SAMN05444266_10239 [Chitinophaga jiangningensis]